MISFIASMFGSPLIKTLVSSIAESRQRATDAKTERERIAAEKEADMWEAQLDARVKAQSTRGLAVFVRAAFAFPFAAYLWKVILWDKIWHGGLVATDPIGPDLQNLMYIVVSFYFLSEAGIQYIRSR